jgi:hypothetical protein
MAEYLDGLINAAFGKKMRNMNREASKEDVKLSRVFYCEHPSLICMSNDVERSYSYFLNTLNEEDEEVCKLWNKCTNLSQV